MTRRSPGEGGVYESPKGSGRWYYKCAITESDGTKKAKLKRGFKNKTEALRAMREVLGEVDQGTYVDPSKRTFASWAGEWLDARAQTSTTQAYRGVLTWYVLPNIGTIPLAMLTSTRISRMYRDLQAHGGRNGKPLKPATVMRCHIALSAALTAAVGQTPALLRKNPAAGAARELGKALPKGRDAQPKSWSLPQLRLFLAWAEAEDQMHYPLWHTLAMTGARRFEVLSIRWGDLDGNVIRFLDTKGGKPREVPVDRETIRLMKAGRKVGVPYVFTTTDGHPVPLLNATNSFTRAVLRAQAALGDGKLPRITLHGLRHTCASAWLRAGVPVDEVARRLGHSPAMLLGTYAHVTRDEETARAEAMARVMLGTGA